MQIKTHIDKKFQEIEIHVCNHEINQNVSNLVNDLNQIINKKIIGTDIRGEKYPLPVNKMIRFYSEKQKVLAQDENSTYTVSYKLYELEQMLDSTRFMRVSKSEIVNLKKIKKLDMSLTGTIRIVMMDGTEAYTSRRNVSRLKKIWCIE